MNEGQLESAWDSPGLDVLGVLGRIAPGSAVADCGCFGWSLARACEGPGHRLVGIDRVEPPGRPASAAFHGMVGPRLDVPDDHVDLAVANHVLEHMSDPVALFGELARITVPGGLVWIEAPSELSALARGSDDPTGHAFASFWDDPTHVRPWTPGALYRLALSWRCRPLVCARGVAGSIPVSRLLARKPAALRGATPYRFVSLEHVPPGLAAAWASVWPDEE